MGTVDDLQRQRRRSIAIHRAALAILQQQPELRFVLLERIPEKRAKRGDLHGWYSEWENILTDGSLEAFRRVAEGEDSHSSDLRSVTPVGSILPADVRARALATIA